MRTVDEQLERVLAAAVRPAPVRVAISDAHGLRCAEEVISSRPLPGFDQAAIDGYAVRSVDLSGAEPDEPVSVPVFAFSRLGGLPDSVQARLLQVASEAALRPEPARAFA
ncbi:MAG: gephyrin-like molybdotransferase Glp, partial [Actinomycetes bacterium]